MLKNKKNNIICDVSTCEHNDCLNKSCSLDNVKISCNSNKIDTTNKKETICDSFNCNCHIKEDKEK